ncbi:MAG: 5'/3'-nucleotidase SurE [Vicinamibacteria bacterium]|nr:5'/3'-nucleotidase SurE [Vicinamibacteria bacterium]
MTRPFRVLVCNDDGYMSLGILALANALEGLGEICVVAPEAEQSAASHSISLHRPLRIKHMRERWWAVDGTPTDCAYLAINHILKDRKPDLCVSGINHGPNMADDVTYSGTVAAAMEASILGVPAIAVSLAARKEWDFQPAARFARALAEAVLATPDVPRDLLLNVNVPPGVDPDGYEITTLGRHNYGFEVVEKTDPRGRLYYWIGGNQYAFEDRAGTDCTTVLKEQRISVTPLHLELTDDRRRPLAASFPVAGYKRA